MTDIKELLTIELDKAKNVLSTLEEIEIQISLYKDELQSDIQSMEMLIQRQSDRKFDQVNSALEFVMSDIMKYAEKSKELVAQNVTQIKLPQINIDKHKEEPEELMKNGRVNNQYLSRLVLEFMNRHPSTVYTNVEIVTYLMSVEPELKNLWKNASGGVSYIMSLIANRVDKIDKGQYMLKKGA